jgi:hypothetical protein
MTSGMGLVRPLLLLGGIVFLVGLALTSLNLKKYRRRKRIRRTALTPAARALGGEIVAIKGRIVPSEQGQVRAPFSGKLAVWVRVQVDELRSPTRRAYWHSLYDDVEARTFLIDDGTGQLARVIPRGAEVLLDAPNVASSGHYYDDPIHLEAFLQSRGSKSTRLLGFSKSMRYKEEVLVAGEFIHAIGFARRESAVPGAHGSQAGPAHQLVLFQSPRDELILTNMSERQLNERLLRAFFSGLVVIGLGLLLSIAGEVIALVLRLRH